MLLRLYEHRGEVRAQAGALEGAVAATGADEVHIVTVPHAVEDTLHTDWGTKARERLGVPVLHVYAGSSWTN